MSDDPAGAVSERTIDDIARDLAAGTMVTDPMPLVAEAWRRAAADWRAAALKLADNIETYFRRFPEEESWQQHDLDIALAEEAEQVARRLEFELRRAGPPLSEYKPPPEQTASAVLVLAMLVLATVGGLVLFVCLTFLGPVGSAIIIGTVGATWAVSWAIETLRAARQWDRPAPPLQAPPRRSEWLSSDEDMERRERERGW